eukprot:6954451-Prymnesium_polylepis.1
MRHDSEYHCMLHGCAPSPHDPSESTSQARGDSARHPPPSPCTDRAGMGNTTARRHKLRSLQIAHATKQHATPPPPPPSPAVICCRLFKCTPTNQDERGCRVAGSAQEWAPVALRLRGSCPPSCAKLPTAGSFDSLVSLFPYPREARSPQSVQSVPKMQPV